MVTLDSPLVGRARERAALDAMLATIDAGEPAVATIVGEPGIGKTALADELARLARRRGVTVLRGAADDVDRSTFAIWRRPMAALGVDLGEPARAGENRRWEALGTIADSLNAAAPIVVVLDDVHWADEGAVWILDRLGAELTSGVAVLATTRPVELGRRRSHAGHVVTLSGLTAGEVGELSAARGHGAIDAVALQQRTAGNPLFVLELLSSPPGTDAVPGAIGVALGHTLDRLPAPVQRSLALLALAGTQAPSAVIAGAANVSSSVLREHFDDAVAAGVLIAPSLASVQFRHALLADTLVGRLTAGERRGLHAALATAWRKSGLTAADGRAAAHDVHAVPTVDPVPAGRRALEAVRTLRAADPATAQQLLVDAIDVVDQYAPGETRLRAELLIELGRAHASVANWPAASAVSERAAALTATLGDPDLHAQAELLAARHLSMFEDDPARRARLARAADGLADGDHPVRVELLGRLSVSELGRSDLWPSARHHVEEAVAMARRLGHPEALATAIIDRHLAAMGRGDIEQRAQAADELVALGQAAGRPDRVLVGLEWRYGAALARGDATAASLVLDEAEVLAALMPSPEWTYGVMLRRALLAAIAGERDVALDLVRRARPLGDRALFAEEALGLEAGARTLVVRITGIADPDLLAVHLEFEQTGGVPAVPFFLVHSAAGALAVGDHDGATRIVRRVAERVCRSEEPAELPSTILLLGELVAELELGEYAEPLRRLCAPFHGFLTTESGFAVSRPADQTLAELALLAGDADAALRHVEACLAMVRAAPSPSYEARALWLRSRVHERLGDHDAARRDLAATTMIARRVGLALPGAAKRPFEAPKRASLTRDGATWRMTSPHGEAVVAHSIGIDQLAMVLAAAPRDVLATDLALTGSPVAAPLGPALDTAAKQAYRRRIAALNAEVDEADRFHDIERAARARVELDALMQELRRAVGVHGRDRPMGSGAERARVNVARSVRRAISTVRAALPDLGAHLEVSVRTGRACAYAPEPGARLEWEVRR